MVGLQTHVSIKPAGNATQPNPTQRIWAVTRGKGASGSAAAAVVHTPPRQPIPPYPESRVQAAVAKGGGFDLTR